MGGGVLGTVATLPLTGIIIEKLNWQFGFYIPAFFALFASILWYLVVSDSPSSHSWISKDEKDYLEKSLNLREKSESKKSMPPLFEMFKSPAFWALNILHFGNVWGLYFLLTAAPKFLNEVFGFNLAKVGFLSSLPYLFRLIFGFIFGFIGDKIRQKNLITVTNTRKSFCIFCKFKL
jgi:MFS transporter, ACS family, solute carrier family 17 (sodium-dependent inorganic phosphate cotransporter), other